MDKHGGLEPALSSTWAFSAWSASPAESRLYSATLALGQGRLPSSFARPHDFVSRTVASGWRPRVKRAVLSFLHKAGMPLAAGEPRSWSHDGEAGHASAPPSPSELLKGASGTVAQEMTLLDEHGVIIAIIASWRTAPAIAVRDEKTFRIGDHYIDTCRSIHPALKVPSLRRGIADVIAGRTPSFTQSYKLGPQRRWQVCVTPLAVAGMSLFVAVDEDITEGPGARLPFSGTTEDVLAVQEAERRRITMELHDSTSQHLVALGLGMARLRRLVAGGGTQDVLEDMSRSVREVGKEIRVLSYLMRPAALEQHGLGATAEGFVEGFGSRTGLAVGFRTYGSVDAAAPAVRHAAYRILQEALSNVYRHANAMSVAVELELARGVLIVRVTDDGQGIAKIREGHPESLQLGVGIDGMRLRVARLGGELEITCPARGTQVVARLPADGGEPVAPDV